VAQSVEFACGLRAREFVSIVAMGGNPPGGKNAILPAVERRAVSPSGQSGDQFGVAIISIGQLLLKL
jgi:hypothetical protein